MKRYIIAIVIILVAGCKPEKVTINKVLFGLKISNAAPQADGTTLVYITAQLNSQADADKRSVIFVTSSGTLVPAKDTSATITATFQNQILVARATLMVPLTPGKIYISVKPAAVSQYGDYIARDTLNVIPSVPSTLMLTPSAVSIKADFGSEILLTALLKNSSGNPVSSGTKVTFADIYPNGQPVGGKYRAIRDSTDATSTAIAYYSIGTGIVSGTTFYLQCSYVAPGGAVLMDRSLITVQ